MMTTPSQFASAHLFAQREPIIDPYIGITLNNRFLIEEKLGEGGFGAVYRGTQEATGRKVALKLLHPEMTRDQNVVERFRREGQVLCSLRDAHTITTYDFDQTADGTLFIAMELLEGRSLHEVFHREAPIEWRRMLKIVVEICSSLAEAHALGIVHRDLKPENIYLERRPGNPEFVKILDFGIAKVVRGDSAAQQAPQLTATGQTLGTLEYMSPEQLMGKQLDGRSDIYALGVVAYELITGRLPFPEAIGPAALITAQLKKTPPSLSAANPAGAIPAAVDAVILKMLGKDKATRFEDAGELATACAQLLEAPSADAFAVAQPEATPAPLLGPPAHPVAPLAHAPLPQMAPGALGNRDSSRAEMPMTLYSNVAGGPSAHAAHVAPASRTGSGPASMAPRVPAGPPAEMAPSNSPLRLDEEMAAKPGSGRAWMWIFVLLVVVAAAAVTFILLR
jgi:serine/threonine-protein kinase